MSQGKPLSPDEIAKHLQITDEIRARTSPRKPVRGWSPSAFWDATMFYMADTEGPDHVGVQFDVPAVRISLAPEDIRARREAIRPIMAEYDVGRMSDDEFFHALQIAWGLSPEDEG